MTTQSSRPILRRLLLALVLAVGTGAIWLTVAGWLMAMLFGGAQGVYQSMVYTAEGEPFIQSYQVANYQNRTYRSLDGQVRKFDEQTWLQPSNAVGQRETSWAAPPPQWKGRIASLNDGTLPATYWYLIHDGSDRGAAYFVGYDSVSNRKVGYLDAAGFHTAAPRQPFTTPPLNAGQWTFAMASSQGGYGYGSIHEPTYYNHPASSAFPGWRAYVIDANRLLEVDLRERERPPRVLMQHDGMLSVQIQGGFQRPRPVPQPTDQPAPETPPQTEALIVSTAREVIAYDPVSGEPAVYQRPEELIGKTVSVYRPVTGGLIIEYTETPLQGESPTHIYTFAADGTLADTQQVVITRGEPGSTTLAAAAFSLAAPVPAIAVLAATVPFPLSKMYYDDSLSYGAALLQSLREIGIYPAIVLLISVGLAVLCYRRQRRYSDPVVTPWIVLILLLGVPGYIGYRLHQHWPLRRNCPVCGMPSPQDRLECVDCGADWPRPEAKGIEVYA